MINEQQYFQELVDTVWPEWKITKRLGKGSYGSVYEMQRDDLGSVYKCAMKVLHMEADEPELGERTLQPDLDGMDPELEKTPRVGYYRSGAGSDSGELEDFVRSVSTEIDLMMRLKGAPNIVNIEDYTVIRKPGSRTILIRMELLESVDQYIKRLGPLSREEVVQLGVEICTALERCEKMSILHRDIKPSNIFYGEHSGFKLGDFGISRTMSSLRSKMSMTGVGTIQYIAPEVYFGKKYDHTVDLYSLGIVLYTLLNDNKPPFCEFPPGSSDSGGMSMLHEANMRRLRGEAFPAPVHAQDSLGEVILAASDPDSAKRYQSAKELQRALKAAAPEEGGIFIPPETQSPVKSPAPARRSSDGTPAPGKRSPGGSPDPGKRSPGGSADPGRGGSVKEKILIALLIVVLCAAGYYAYQIIFGRGSDSVSSAGSPVKEEESSASSAGSPVEEEESSAPSATVSYTILSNDMEGTTLARQEKEGRVGEAVTESPSPIDGYTSLSEEKSITLSESPTDNIIVFMYQKNEPQPAAVSYIVVCEERDSGDQLYLREYQGEPGETIRFRAPDIEGYTAEDQELEITLSKDESENVLFFTYVEDRRASMKIPDSDTLSYGGHTYYVERTGSIDSFGEAEEYCESLGGHLAVINDSAENAALYDFVFFEMGYPSAYFGYTDEGSEGRWYWVDGTEAGYESFQDGQPDNSRGKENYALFYYKDDDYKWNDADFGKDSDGNVYFIIEWDA